MAFAAATCAGACTGFVRCGQSRNPTTTVAAVNGNSLAAPALRATPRNGPPPETVAAGDGSVSGAASPVAGPGAASPVAGRRAAPVAGAAVDDRGVRAAAASAVAGVAGAGAGGVTGVVVSTGAVRVLGAGAIVWGAGVVDGDEDA